MNKNYCLKCVAAICYKVNFLKENLRTRSSKSCNNTAYNTNILGN